MAQIEYRSSIWEKSWRIPMRYTKPSRKILFGIWCRTTTDRVLPASDDLRKDTHRFEYDPLPRQSIRLLSLDPGRPDDILQGSLRTVSLKEIAQDGGYEALSYVWGRSGNRDSIDIDGRYLEITANLSHALREMRSTRATRLVWIDAICIDQGNVEERSVQVSIMRDIYAAAHRVIVWLGRSTEDTCAGMKILKHFAQGEPYGEKAPWRSMPPQIVRSGLEDVVHRPWFTRYWVVQEAALAKEVVLLCGGYSMEWSNDCRSVLTFSRSLKLAATSPPWQHADLDDINIGALIDLLQMQLEGGPEKKLWAQRRHRPDILEYAYSMRFRQATDIRDKIYGLIGFASADTVEKLRPDYSQDAEQVLDNFATVVTNETIRMCEEFDAMRKVEEENTGQQSGTPPKTESRAIGHEQPLSLEQFIELTCARATEDARSGDFRGAADLMESAAMLLRSESFGPFR